MLNNRQNNILRTPASGITCDFSKYRHIGGRSRRLSKMCKRNKQQSHFTTFAMRDETSMYLSGMPQFRLLTQRTVHAVQYLSILLDTM